MKISKWLFDFYSPLCNRISGWFYDRWVNKQIMTSDYNMRLAGWFIRRAIR